MPSPFMIFFLILRQGLTKFEAALGLPMLSEQAASFPSFCLSLLGSWDYKLGSPSPPYFKYPIQALADFSCHSGAEKGLVYHQAAVMDHYVQIKPRHEILFLLCWGTMVFPRCWYLSELGKPITLRGSQEHGRFSLVPWSVLNISLGCV